MVQSIEGNKLVVKPRGNLINNTSYQLSISQNLVMDVDKDRLDLDYSLSYNSDLAGGSNSY